MNNLKYILAEPGDSYYGIAGRLGISPDRLQIANSYLPLHPGSVVALPDELFWENPPEEEMPPPDPEPQPDPEPPTPTPDEEFTPGRLTQKFGVYLGFNTTDTAGGQKLPVYTEALGGLPDGFMASAMGETPSQYGSPIWGQFVGPNAFLPSISDLVYVDVIVPLNPDGGSQMRARTDTGLAEIRNSLWEVANGRDDELHIRQAQRLVAAGFPDAIIRLGNESDSQGYGSSVYKGGNHEAFIAAFRHVVEVWRSVSDRFEFNWTCMRGTWSRGLSQIGYPGDDWVDYCGMDIYYRDSTAPTQEEIQSHIDVMANHAAFAAERGKQVCYPEWATAGFDDPQYFKASVAWHKSLGNQLAFAHYFASSSDHGNGPYDPMVYPKIWEAFVNEYKR